MLAAEDWHTPPWEIERRAPDIWMERWRVLQEARYKAQQRGLEVGQTSTRADGKQVTRII